MRQTSVDAYNQIKSEGLLSVRRWETYDPLYHHGPMTAGQVGLLLPGKGRAASGNVHARLGELRERGVVMELGTVICPVTQQRVILWDVTANIPLKLEKPKRTKCKNCDGKGYFTEQQTKLF